MVLPALRVQARRSRTLHTITCASTCRPVPSSPSTTHGDLAPWIWWDAGCSSILVAQHARTGAVVAGVRCRGVGASLPGQDHIAQGGPVGPTGGGWPRQHLCQRSAPSGRAVTAPAGVDHRHPVRRATPVCTSSDRRHQADAHQGYRSRVALPLSRVEVSRLRPRSGAMPTPGLWRHHQMCGTGRPLELLLPHLPAVAAGRQIRDADPQVPLILTLSPRAGEGIGFDRRRGVRSHPDSHVWHRTLGTRTLAPCTLDTLAPLSITRSCYLLGTFQRESRVHHRRGGRPADRGLLRVRQGEADDRT